MHVAVADFVQQVIESDGVNKQGFVQTGQVGHLDALGQEGVAVKLKLLKGRVLEGHVEFLFVARLEKQRVEPVLDILFPHGPFVVLALNALVLVLSGGVIRLGSR